MNMNAIITSVIGLVIGVGGTLGVSALMSNGDNKQTAITQQQAAETEGTPMSMSEMNKQLENLSGDDYDKAFLEMMIAHHQGAIDMAKLSSTRAKNDKIKQLSTDIIAAQEKEIAEMQQWQMDWGYKTSTDSMPGMNH